MTCGFFDLPLEVALVLQNLHTLGGCPPRNTDYKEKWFIVAVISLLQGGGST